MKFRNILTALLVTATLFLSASCSDFLDKTPTSLTSGSYFANASEAKSFLDGIEAIPAQDAFYGNTYYYLVGGDDLEYYGPSSRSPYATGMICNNATASSADVASFWRVLYSGINRANIFLSRVDGVSDLDSATVRLYKAKARFLRAFFYFNLVECWGDVPFRTQPTETVVGLSAPRTPKARIYDFICKEMEEAAEDLPTAASVDYLPGDITKSAAWGMLARVYMFRAGEHYRDNVAANDTEVRECFTQADKFAKMVKEQGGHSLAPHYWDVFIDQCSGKFNSTGKEIIWEVEFSGNGTSDTRTEGRVGNIIGIQAPDLSKTSYTGKQNPGFSYAFFYGTPKIYELYQANGDINRMNWSLAPFKYMQLDNKTGNPIVGRLFNKGKLAEVKQQYWDESFSYGDNFVLNKSGDGESTDELKNYNLICGKWRREYEPDVKDKNRTAIDFPILRYSDILLMIAECENELNGGPTAEAYACIKAVRGRAGIAPLSEGLTQDAFREAVKDERAMEFCFEMTRRFDLIRWGEYVDKMNEVARRAIAGDNWADGMTNTYNYFRISSTYNYFPIPTIETSVNDQITTNNPGW